MLFPRKSLPFYVENVPEWLVLYSLPMLKWKYDTLEDIIELSFDILFCTTNIHSRSNSISKKIVPATFISLIKCRKQFANWFYLKANLSCVSGLWQKEQKAEPGLKKNPTEESHSESFFHFWYETLIGKGKVSLKTILLFETFLSICYFLFVSFCSFVQTWNVLELIIQSLLSNLAILYLIKSSIKTSKLAG